MTGGDGVRKGADGGEKVWLLLCQLLSCGNSGLMCPDLPNCQRTRISRFLLEIFGYFLMLVINLKIKTKKQKTNKQKQTPLQQLGKSLWTRFDP